MSNALTSYRKANKLSLAAFAVLVGASKSMVWKWESGETIPRRRYVERIYAVTDGTVTANDFMALPADRSEPLRQEAG